MRHSIVYKGRKRRLHPLDDGSRRKLFTFAVVCCSVPLLLAPLAGRSAFEVRGERDVLVQRFQETPLSPVPANASVTIDRDPFIADNPPGDVVGMHVIRGASTGIALPGVPIVRAIVSGTSPRALIDENGHARVVQTGDPIAGSKIVSIRGDGIVLQNGVVLKLVEQEQ
jgi:hypothetical protein